MRAAPLNAPRAPPVKRVPSIGDNDILPDMGRMTAISLGRKSWLFAGSDRGGQRAAAMYSIIFTAKMCDVDPQVCPADVLARIA